MALPDQLASITYDASEEFADAMLKVYKQFIEQICARATRGMNRAVLRPEPSALGDESNYYPPVIVADAMVKLLKAEGLEAHRTTSHLVYCRWPAYPFHRDVN